MNHHNRIKKLEDNLLISEKYYVPLTYGYRRTGPDVYFKDGKVAGVIRAIHVYSKGRLSHSIDSRSAEGNKILNDMGYTKND